MKAETPASRCDFCYKRNPGGKTIHHSTNSVSRGTIVVEPGRDPVGMYTALSSRNCFFNDENLFLKVQYSTDTGTFSQMNGTRRV